MKNTKIFIITHNSYIPTNSDSWSNLFVGNVEHKYSNAFYDNVGSNISSLNDLYNELTGIYWVYKHIDEFNNYSHIGFSHYRRFFVNANKPVVVKHKINNNIFTNSFQLDINSVVVPYPIKVCSVKQSYSKAHNSKDIELVMTIINEMFPQHYQAAKEYFSGNKSYLYNMFIMNKKDFVDYGNFIFPLLKEFKNKSINLTSRLYISERLTGLYLYILFLKKRQLIETPICLIRSHNLIKAIKETKHRTKLKEDKSIVYKLKPLWLAFMPNKVEQFLRNKQRKFQ